MAKLHLEVITPEGTLLALEAEAVRLPTRHRGEYGILPGHTPLLVDLGQGLLHLRQDGLWHWVAVWGGVAEVIEDRVTVLARHSEAGTHLDPTAVEAEIQRAHRLAEEARTERDLDRAIAAMEWAMLRGELLKSPAVPARQLLGEPNMPD